MAERGADHCWPDRFRLGFASSRAPAPGDPSCIMAFSKNSGVQRNAISIARHNLQHATIIRCSRGHAETANVEGLSETSRVEFIPTGINWLFNDR
jgi:hypothetical protein